MMANEKLPGKIHAEGLKTMSDMMTDISDFN